MVNWKRVFQLHVFSEEHDVGRGPRWATLLLLCAAFVGYIAFGAAILAAIAGAHFRIAQAGSVFVVAFAVMSGAAWHLEMPGRAKNGLMLSLIGLALVLAIG